MGWSGFERRDGLECAGVVVVDQVGDDAAGAALFDDGAAPGGVTIVEVSRTEGGFEQPSRCSAGPVEGRDHQEGPFALPEVVDRALARLAGITEQAEDVVSELEGDPDLITEATEDLEEAR